MRQPKRARADEDSPRPYRLWDANNKINLRWRYYSDPKRAHMGAIIECRWSKEGTVIEVYNAATGQLLGQYKRLATSIAFYR